jgi:hypothetical protein
MSKGGGTWRIVVEEGKITSPTQSTIVSSGTKVTKPELNTTGNTEASVSGRRVVQKGLVVGTLIARAGINQYHSITGQTARRNELNTTLAYGAAVTSIGIQLATMNLAGAAITALGTGVALGNQVVNFQRNVTDSNAMAEYLRQQSGTSVSGNRGELYSFKLF